jgi:nucleotide-binding universal stress UspA family protein
VFGALGMMRTWHEEDDMNDAGEVQANRVVVGLDLTETGDRALVEALSLVRQLPNSELHVAHAIAVKGSLHGADLDHTAHELRARLAEIRVRVTEITAFPWVGGEMRRPIVFHVRLGEPAAVLHQVAVDVDAMLIVVGTHARTGVQKLLLGSVADVLARTARVSVLVAHPKNFAGLERSEHPEPARPGEVATSRAAISERRHLEFRDRSVHISGLI